MAEQEWWDGVDINQLRKDLAESRELERSNAFNVTYLKQQLAEREAELAYLKDFMFDYVDIEPDNEKFMVKYHRMINTPRTSYLEQWEKEKLEKSCKK